jgi:hypothetical protein
MRQLPGYSIPGSRGGLNHNPNIDDISPESMIHPSRNINLHQGGRESRGGTTKINGTAGYGSQRLMGAYDYTNSAGTQFTVVGTTDGKIWKDTTTTIKTGLTIGKHFSFAEMNGKLYITNGADRPQVWDGIGASTTDLVLIPTDWTGTSFPFKLIVHGRGNSERMWAIGAKPKTIYASKNNDGVAEADFSNANVLTFFIETGDQTGITGGIEFGDRLVLFSKRRSFIMVDDDLTVANWGYEQAQWLGGAANHKVIVKIANNDALCMTDDGDIYSFTAVQSYGDYKAASLVRPAFIDKWIRDYIDLTQIANFHGIYNPMLRYVDFFMDYKDIGSNNNVSLRFFLDRSPAEAWMPQDNQTSASGYGASTSFLFKVADGNYQIRTGDYSGFIWRLETANKNDDSLGYYAGFRTPFLTFGDNRTTKHYKRGRITAVPKGNWNLQVKTFVDLATYPAQNISLAGTGAVLGSFLLGTDSLGGQEIVDKIVIVDAVGKRISREYFNSNANEAFFISSLQEDFKPISVRP